MMGLRSRHCSEDKVPPVWLFTEASSQHSNAYYTSSNRDIKLRIDLFIYDPFIEGERLKETPVEVHNLN
jgi:hypothetical protein